LKDFFDARSIGVTHIVGPMIESAYALKKYLSSAKTAFQGEEFDSVKFLVNIETITAAESIEDILSRYPLDGLSGIVIGRVDLTGSMGLTRENVNDDNLFVVGGGVSKETIPFLRRFAPGSIARYETRKVIFGCPAALEDGYDKGILKAVGFELMWLKNKRDFYGQIYKEDMTRIEMLEKRYKGLIEEAGGQVE